MQRSSNVLPILSPDFSISAFEFDPVSAGAIDHRLKWYGRCSNVFPSLLQLFDF
jgi:hypothetical protein